MFRVSFLPQVNPCLRCFLKGRGRTWVQVTMGVPPPPPTVTNIMSVRVEKMAVCMDIELLQWFRQVRNWRAQRSTIPKLS